MGDDRNEKSIDNSFVGEHRVETDNDFTMESVNIDAAAADRDLDKAVLNLGGTGYVPIVILE